jgi:hydrogenase expression/formation protein HypC
MCLAIPGRVDEVFEENGLKMGKVNFGGIIKRVCLDFVPEIAVSDYAIVHVGFAIERVDQETAEKTLEVFRTMGMLEEELADGEEAILMAASRTPSNCPDGSCDSASQQVSRSASQRVSKSALRGANEVPY